MRKTKKNNKIEKYADSGHKLEKLVSNLRMITKIGGKIRKIYDNFFFLVQILTKIIINFSNFSIFQFM